MISDDERSLHYALLSRFLTDQLLLQDMQVIRDVIKTLTLVSQDMLEPVFTAIENHGGDESTIEQWRAEYAHLFLLPGGVKPFESSYLGEGEGLMKQEPWVNVKKFYRKCGLQMESDLKHAEDHVSVELAFMHSIICSGGNEEMQSEFFITHINQWIPQLFKDVTTNRHADFYAKVATYGLQFIEMERHVLANKNN